MASAAAAAARSFLRSSSSRITAARVAYQAKSGPSPFRFASKKPQNFRSVRSPVEMSFCVESLLPFHSATASALMTSMLSVSCHGYGWLPEGQDQTW